MPYKDPVRRREYKKLWLRKRRQMYLGSSMCAHCGAREHLQLHHLDPAEKDTHRIFGWAHERILTELSKCIILCQDCHTAVHAEEAIPIDSERILRNLEAMLPL